MNKRIVLAVAFLVAIELLERGAYYGTRSVLYLTMIRELGLESEATREAVRLLTWTTYGMPFLGALLAIGIGPRFALAIGAVVAGAGFGLLVPADTLPAMQAAFVVLGIGSGMMKPCITAALADALPDPQETGRNAAFVAFYLSINVAATLSTILAPATAAQGHAEWVFAASSGATLLAGLLALAFALLWRFLPEPLPEEPRGEGRWLRIGAGALLLCLLALPYYVVLDQAGSAPFFAQQPAEGVQRLVALNPVFVTMAGFFLLLALGGALAAGFRVRAVLLIGVGFLVTAAGALPVLVAPESFWAVAISVAVMAGGEALAGGLLLSRTLSGHHWRAKACFGAAGLGAVLLANIPASFLEFLPDGQRDFARWLLLLAAISTTAVIGTALAAAHRPISRFFWPEEHAAEPAAEASTAVA